MSPDDLTAIAVLSLTLADLDPRQWIKALEKESDASMKEIEAMREAGRAIIAAKAAMTHSYFCELVRSGFTEAQALTLTINFKPEMEFGLNK
jgi:alkylhydroperoxidase family enzyme